jgi:uncharacterized protein YcbK (DUF882 family)
MTKLTKHFSEKEFACKCKCNKGFISQELVNKLEEVRIKFGKVMRVTSGVRCLEHNLDIGSRKTSSHIPNEDGIGRAADISCRDIITRSELLPLMLEEFERVGINKTFIHVDVDYKKHSGVFVY